MTLLLVLLGGLIGAPARYLTDRALPSPAGTLLVNVAGSLLLGLLTGATIAGPVHTLAGTGFCGALTTYSTFSYETLRLLEQGRTCKAIVYVSATLLAGLAAAAVGVHLAP